MRLSWLEGEGEVKASDLAAIGVVARSVAETETEAELSELRTQRGYTTQDIIELRPDTPNLEGILAKFKDEHLHRDDEVRFVIAGAGVFDVRSADERWLRIEVERGDLIVVPAMLYHRFFLTDQRQIRCVRLFKDAAGWVPEYRA